ncbi:MAG: hypothetical protein ABI026_04050 [Gemmatimonadaceae bacterium]
MSTAVTSDSAAIEERETTRITPLEEIRRVIKAEASGTRSPTATEWRPDRMGDRMGSDRMGSDLARCKRKDPSASDIFGAELRRPSAGHHLNEGG